MKILILSPWFAPAYNAGGPVRSLNNLVKMSMEGMENFVLTANQDVDGIVLNNVSSNQWIPFCEGCSVMYLEQRNLMKNIKKEIAVIKPDLLFICGIYSLPFSKIGRAHV